MVGVVAVPENVLKKFYKSILPQWKICFFVALAAGLFAHFYKITNWIPNWDSLVFRYHSQNMLGLGRWFLPIACSFTSFYDLPFLNGVVSILFHALGAVYICSVLGVQKKITAGLVGAFIATFPAVTSVMMYAYVADGYAISFFLSTLVAFLLTRDKPRLFTASILLALSLGIYQAYITVTIMLLLFHLIDGVIFKGVSFRLTFKKAIKMLLSGVVGVVLYAVILKIALAVFSTELLDYQGANAVATLSGFDLAASLYVIKESFLNCFFDISSGINVYVVLNAFILVFTLLYYVKSIVVNKVYKSPLKVVTVIFLGVMLILGAGVLAFVNPMVDYHNLMLMGYCVFYLFFLLIYEREGGTLSKYWTVLITALILIANQVVIANVSYHKAHIAYEKSYGVLVRIADRIDSTAGSGECDRILVIGALDDSRAYSVNLTPDITGITDGYIIRADDETVGQSVLTSALNDYCGKNYVFLSGDEKRAMLQREEIKSMEKWPAENCVAIVEDTIVIKLGTEGEDK